MVGFSKFKCIGFEPIQISAQDTRDFTTKYDPIHFYSKYCETLGQENLPNCLSVPGLSKNEFLKTLPGP